MNGRRRLVELWLPWVGLAGAGLAWALSHQIGSDMTFADCRAGNPLSMGLVGLLALALAAASGIASWRLWRREGETEVRRFLGFTGLLFALLLGLAILLQTIAGFILPGCLA